MSDPADWDLPAVSTDEIARWIDHLAAAPELGRAPGRLGASARARRELEDVLARDQYVSQVKRMLKARLADPDLAPGAAAHFEELVDLTRPAMVAEYWEGRRHLGIQHLLVGVPSMSPAAVRPSHFDRIDDQVAHCASGSNLLPGDYPVGVAIPHPRRRGAVFHLVNLPTARRRMAYEYHVERDEAERLAELSRRTLKWLLADRRPLSEAELRMLWQLDPREVSRAAGELFDAVEDGRLSAAAELDAPPYQTGPIRAVERMAGRPSRHAMICALLAAEGTHEAAESLLKAIDGSRFLPPTREAPYGWPWIAALAIAGRDPWAGVDAWLAGVTRRSDRLVEGADQSPELGATAAGLLLKRHGQEPLALGLEPIGEPVLAELGVAGYRFSSPKGAEKIESWWAERKKKLDPEP